MRILFVTYMDDYSKDAGDKIYSASVIESLQKCARVDVIDFTGNNSLKASNWKSVASIYPSSIYVHKNSFTLKEFYYYITDNTYDLVVFDHLRVLWLSEYLPKAKKITSVYLSHNVEFESRKMGFVKERNIVKKIALWLDYFKTRYWEHRLIKSVDVISAISSTDENYFKTLGKKVVTLVPGYSGQHLNNKVISESCNKIAWVGSFRFFAKRLNLLEFCDRVKSLNKGHLLDLKIIGSMDDEFCNYLKSNYHFCKVFPNVDNVYTHLSDTSIGIICESVGGGFKLKSLDYLFTKNAIFCLDSSCEGLPAATYEYIQSSTDVDSLIDLIIEKKNDYDFLNFNATKAYEISRDHFNWDFLVERFLNDIK